MFEGGELSEPSADIAQVFVGYFRGLFASEELALDDAGFQAGLRDF